MGMFTENIRTNGGRKPPLADVVISLTREVSGGGAAMHVLGLGTRYPACRGKRGVGVVDEVSLCARHCGNWEFIHCVR